jgi:hypothetical protein
MADHITNLTDIYNRWLDQDENKNVDKGSADDVLLFDESLTTDQKNFLERFCDLWETAQDHEYELKLNRAYKEERRF